MASEGRWARRAALRRFRARWSRRIGTFWLVLGGCGAAVLAAGADVPGSIGLVGVSLAFGLTVFSMTFAIGFVLGERSDPGVTVGLAVGGHFQARDLPGYIAAQIVGGILGSAALAALASGTVGFDLVASGFAANGYDAYAPGGYGVGTAFLAGAILTAGFLTVILGATDERSAAAFAPLSIGLALT